jgi:SAM-dependent methyltransferase
MDGSPSAPGTQRDIREGTDLLEEAPFFASQIAALEFVSLGLSGIENDLPSMVTYVDFGGGPGILTRAVRDRIIERGHGVRAVVVDANPFYLARAAQFGLETILANIQSQPLDNVDLATMRMVNHYDDLEGQLGLLRSVRRSLASRGILVSQIESGNSAVCALRTKIANLTSLSGEHACGYWWTTALEYQQLLEAADFLSTRVAATSKLDIPVDDLLTHAWSRFNDGTMKRLLDEKDDTALARLHDRKSAFLREAHMLTIDLLDRNGDSEDGLFYLAGVLHIRTTTPIFVSRP